MAWVQLSTFTTGQLLTATDMNNIKGNLEYLAAGSYVVQEPATGSDYTTTSTTFVDVDGTEFDVDIETSDDASAVRVWAQLTVNGPGSGHGIAFEFTRDGTRLAGAAGDSGVGFFETNNTRGTLIYFQYIDDGITPGNTHSYRLQWRMVTSGTGRIEAASTDHPLLGVEELH